MNRIQDQLELIADMPRECLNAEWQRLFGKAPPRGFNLDMLRLGLTYDLQSRKSGHLPSGVARSIERGARTGPKARMQNTVLPVGTRLARDWHGVCHHVLVTDIGYNYRDRHFGSLTAIAREITGAAWSGPRFFGLSSKARRVGRA
jgi:Protein of unknown function (DUF2924)